MYSGVLAHGMPVMVDRRTIAVKQAGLLQRSHPHEGCKLALDRLAWPCPFLKSDIVKEVRRAAMPKRHVLVRQPTEKFTSLPCQCGKDRGVDGIRGVRWIWQLGICTRRWL